MSAAGPTAAGGVLVVGSLNLDLVARVARLPREGETVLATGYAEHGGGKGANQALAAARAGARVAMVGAVGRDAAGRRLRAALADAGVDVTRVREDDAPTGRAWIEVDDAGANRIVVVPGANAALRPADLPAPADVAAAWWVVQREVPDATVAAALAAARAAGVRTLANLAPAGPVPDDVLALCDAVVVNEHEAAVVLGEADAAEADAGTADAEAPETEARRARALAARAGGWVVLTLGARGALLATAGGVERVPGYAVRPVDTTGAGDAFVGALAARLAAGDPPPRAVAFANAAGAEATLRDGAQPSLPTEAAIRARLGEG